MNIYICELKEQEWKSPLLRAAMRSGLLDSSEAEALAQNEKKLQNQREHLTAWLLFQRVTGEMYGIQTLSELSLAKTEQGKPYSRAYPGLHFNLSHCRAACACALDTIPVGIDIERRFLYKESLMRRICTEKERRIVESCESLPERERLLQALWSMKESVVKWNGRGMGYGMERADCTRWLLRYVKNAGGISDKSEDRNPELWMLLRQTPEYTLAACTAAGKVAFGDWLEAVQITKIREEELCASWL